MSFHNHDGEALNQRIVLYGILTALCILQCFFIILCTGLYESNKKQDAQTRTHNILSIMSVGRPGVGKSTIGNMLLSEKPKGDFPVSTSSKSCTQIPRQLLSPSGDCKYTDVPGIPDTNPENTAKFYDMIIKEAKKPLTVILFLFKREREDPEAYMLAEMLFRELNKSNAAKILVINDQNNYAFERAPTEEDYEEQVTTIKQLTKIDFTHSFVVTAKSMKEKMTNLKIMLSKMNQEPSGHLKSFYELKMLVNKLRGNKNYKEEILRQERDHIARLERQLKGYQGIVEAATATSVLGTVALFFTMGASTVLLTPAVVAAAAATAAMQIKTAELKKAEKRISTDNIEKAAQEFKEACEKFVELEKALKGRF